MIADAVDRGLFRPAEEAALLAWFARFLTIRSELWEVIGDVSAPVDGRVEGIFDTEEWRCFVLGYTSACLVVRLDRYAARDRGSGLGDPTQAQRGIGAPSHPPQAVHRDLRVLHRPRQGSADGEGHAPGAQPAAAVERHERTTPSSASSWSTSAEREKVLEPSRRRYFKLLINYLVHTFRRRGASARQQAVFATLETGGRLASELRDQWSPCRVDDELRNRIDALLQPGDVLICRHERALTNLFLPGFWPHAALYIGSEDDRRQMEITIDEDRATPLVRRSAGPRGAQGRRSLPTPRGDPGGRCGGGDPTAARSSRSRAGNRPSRQLTRASSTTSTSTSSAPTGWSAPRSSTAPSTDSAPSRSPSRSAPAGRRSRPKISSTSPSPATASSRSRFSEGRAVPIVWSRAIRPAKRSAPQTESTQGRSRS